MTRQRRILLCATGLSPQIVTETLYALAREDNVPDEIHLITTAEGANRARLNLLSEEPGWFHRLCRDYTLPPIRFDNAHIHVLRSASGLPLDDIRSREDNRRAADAITEQVRRLTREPASTVHVSIAGGRKTMGFFAGYALSLFGRPQDRLSHVLVSPAYESHPDFYYPTPYARVIHTPPPDSRPLDTREAEVTLADIPFVRLRGHLDRGLLSEGASYSDTVRRAQRGLEPPELVLDPAGRRVRCGDVILTLPPTLFACYAWFARRLLDGRPGIHWSQAGVAGEFLAEYATIVNEYSGDYEKAETSLIQGMKREFLDPKKSKLNETLRDALGPAAASDYQLQDLGDVPGSRYKLHGLTLEPEQVRFGVVE